MSVNFLYHNGEKINKYTYHQGVPCISPKYVEILEERIQKLYTETHLLNKALDKQTTTIKTLRQLVEKGE